VPFDPRVREVIDGHRRTFESLGCVVEEQEPDFAPAEISFRIIRAWTSANSYGDRLRAHPDAFKEVLKAEIEQGLRLTGADVARAEVAHGRVPNRFTGTDCAVSGACPTCGVKLGRPGEGATSPPNPRRFRPPARLRFVAA